MSSTSTQQIPVAAASTSPAKSTSSSNPSPNKSSNSNSQIPPTSSNASINNATLSTASTASTLTVPVSSKTSRSSGYDSDNTSGGESEMEDNYQRRGNKNPNASDPTLGKKKSLKTKHRKINRKHPEFELTYDMMLGIRTTVGKIQAQAAQKKKNQDPSPEDMKATVSLRFPGKGSTLTPAHAMRDFKFKDYSPEVFRCIRERFGINPVDYLLCVCGNFQYLEFISNSKSGQFFFYSHDRKYMIKTISHEESLFLREILPHYYHHIKENPDTLLTRFYGMHRVKPHKKKQVHFLIMGSVFYTTKTVHDVFDLKGSRQGRSATQKEKESGAPVYKDNDFLDRKVAIKLGKERTRLLNEQIAKDVEFLRQRKIMDYSLLLGIHYRDRERDTTDNETTVNDRDEEEVTKVPADRRYQDNEMKYDHVEATPSKSTFSPGTTTNPSSTTNHSSSSQPPPAAVISAVQAFSSPLKKPTNGTDKNHLSPIVSHSISKSGSSTSADTSDSSSESEDENGPPMVHFHHDPSSPVTSPTHKPQPAPTKNSPNHLSNTEDEHLGILHIHPAPAPLRTDGTSSTPAVSTPSQGSTRHGSTDSTTSSPAGNTNNGNTTTTVTPSHPDDQPRVSRGWSRLRAQTLVVANLQNARGSAVRPAARIAHPIKYDKKATPAENAFNFPSFEPIPGVDDQFIINSELIEGAGNQTDAFYGDGDPNGEGRNKENPSPPPSPPIVHFLEEPTSPTNAQHHPSHSSPDALSSTVITTTNEQGAERVLVSTTASSPPQPSSISSTSSSANHSTLPATGLTPATQNAVDALTQFQSQLKSNNFTSPSTSIAPTTNPPLPRTMHGRTDSINDALHANASTVRRSLGLSENKDDSDNAYSPNPSKLDLFSCDGGCCGMDDDKPLQPNNEIYFMGIIDILTLYNVKKKLEHWAKTFKYKEADISAVNPTLYAERFKKFLGAAIR